MVIVFLNLICRFAQLVTGLQKKEFTKDLHIPNVLVFAANTDLHDHPLYKDGSIILQEKVSSFLYIYIRLYTVSVHNLKHFAVG